MPKKGGKKGVQGKRTAMAEEEMAKQKKDIATKLINDMHQKEERNSVINWHKLMEKWQAVFRQTRAQELRADIDVLSQTSKRVLDHKDIIIKELVDQLRESKQQPLRYLQNVDQLLDQHKSRLAFLNQKFDTELDDLRPEFNSDRQQVMVQHQQDCAYQKDVCFALDQHDSAADSKAQLEFLSNQHDIKNKYIEQMDAQRAQLELELEEMWKQLQDATCTYHEATDDHHATCAILQARDGPSCCQTDARDKRIQKIQETCVTLRDKFRASMQQAQAAMPSQQAHKEKATNQCREQRTQLGNICAQYKNNISKLIMQSSAAAKKLQGVIVKGERLVRLAEACRRLETAQERVQPFYCSPVSSEEQGLEKAQQQESTTPELDQAKRDHPVLDGICQRHSRVQLHQLSLRRERAVLTRQNKQLMHQELDGLVVNGDTLLQRNDLPTTSRSAQCQHSSSQQKGALELQHTS
ncbi:hypothetical protein AAFF_G00080430 [Aldrovandia affinis]|uniref:Dynein regulatory complex subunit 2 n=1 Tax=Aldrovandia affinis TaxID=143900 RepID=A0AAD7T366_9TELE|nr:hypothetical protein AAFF_G00080430 [Aldrovandia affinis]